ncbi:MAG TPA: Asp-tRNA(Asn)/Glu-tRNA(Gln) amidotransferase subunit GatA [Candidatus Saccharibacteria bacterium]|nr:Asp-tRNA(Asn)/Glu-tRNA(Gln) amidotransferase subunit GatA [Candidatus Saccharibacteria bacterium]
MKTWPKISEIAEGVQSGKITALKNVTDAFELLEKLEAYKTVISLTKERALKRAKEIDERVKNNENVGTLAGVPFIAKDNFLTFGGDTTAASNILKGFKAPYQSTAINLLEAEGAICIAKSNLDAFAHGSSTENSDFHTTLNPFDKTRVPGGSSGGSAAAVELGIVPFALGTDTGGSIRLPSSYCGVVGYKPTYGLVSRSGVIAMASSTDVIGPITKTVEDNALVLDVISGKDKLDSTTISKDPEGYLLSEDEMKGKTVGVVSELMGEGVDTKVKEAVQSSIEKLITQGVKVKEVSLESLPIALAVYYVVVPAEISSNLMRYDGQRYGYSSKSASNLDESYEYSRSEGFGAEAKRRIMIGTYVLSSGYYDAYYKKAQTVRTKLINEFSKAFEDVDFLISPTAPTPAFKIGENAGDPLQMYLVDVMTVGASLVGVPAISLPIGSADGLPVGMQVMSYQKNDKALLNFASLIERGEQ